MQDGIVPRLNPRQVINMQTLINSKLTCFTDEGLFRAQGHKGQRVDFEALMLPIARKYPSAQFMAKACNVLQKNPQFDSMDNYTWAALAKQCFMNGDILDYDNLKVLACWHSLHKSLQKILLETATLEPAREHIQLQDCFMQFLGQLNNLNQKKSITAIYHFIHLGYKTCQESNHNRMTAENIAMTFAPCLLEGLKLEGSFLQAHELSPKALIAKKQEHMFATQCVQALLQLDFFHLQLKLDSLSMQQGLYHEELARLRGRAHQLSPLSFVPTKVTAPPSSQGLKNITHNLDSLHIKTDEAPLAHPKKDRRHSLLFKLKRLPSQSTKEEKPMPFKRKPNERI